MRKNRISETIGNIDQKYVNEATAYIGDAKAVRRPAWMKWGAIAACFALVAIIGFGVFQSGLFGGNEQIATLDNGSKINFVKSDGGVAQFDIAFEISTRDLTEDENSNLFGDLPVTGYALFNNEDDSILGIEGQYGDMKLLVSASGIKISDTVIDGEEKASDVDGVSVNAGYFTSGKTVIYYATFELGESTVYIENAGKKDESKTVRNDISDGIQKIIALEKINLSSITK
ncbi:MAG: hypothetical protein J6B55_00935 [Clostridia bacterium]|nr:hypothetical protein [Clostridia bacterium]